MPRRPRPSDLGRPSSRRRRRRRQQVAPPPDTRIARRTSSVRGAADRAGRVLGGREHRREECRPWPSSVAQAARTTAPVEVRAAERRPDRPSPIPGTVRATADRRGPPARAPTTSCPALVAIATDHQPTPHRRADQGRRRDRRPRPPQRQRTSSSWVGSIPGSSNGSRRRRCGRPVRQRGADVLLGHLRSARQAACRHRVRATTRSARMPSTSKAAQTAAMRCSSPSGSTIGHPGPARQRSGQPRSASCAPVPRGEPGRVSFAGQPGLDHRAAHRDVPWDACTSTARPNRSSNCGRSSPSSGFMVPTNTNLASCRCDTPSRSMCTAHRRGVEQDVDEVVRQQVDLVDGEQTAVPGPADRVRRRARRPVAPSSARVQEPTTRSPVAPIGEFTSAASGSAPATTAASAVPRRGFGGALLSADQHRRSPGAPRTAAAPAAGGHGRRWR